MGGSRVGTIFNTLLDPSTEWLPKCLRAKCLNAFTQHATEGSLTTVSFYCALLLVPPSTSALHNKRAPQSQVCIACAIVSKSFLYRKLWVVCGGRGPVQRKRNKWRVSYQSPIDVGTRHPHRIAHRDPPTSPKLTGIIKGKMSLHPMKMGRLV